MTCSVDECSKPAKARGYCDTHYARWRKWGDPAVVRKPWGTHERATCEHADCDQPAHARGYCERHYWRLQNHGSPDYERETPHGAYRYRHLGCRCEVCAAGNREKGRRARLSAAERQEQAPHGTANGYSRWSCRCEECRSAWADYRREQLASNPESRELARERGARYEREQWAESLPRAVKHGDEWTGPELEIALRSDLTVVEIAEMLNRTTRAVRSARYRARHDPKYANLAGVIEGEQP